MITRPPGGIGFVTNPGPYLWNAILAFAASKGWALRPGLSQEQLEAGNELFFNDVRLQNLAFQCPRLMPNQQSVNLPQWLRSLCAVTG